MNLTDKSVELVVSKLESLAQQLGITIENIYPYFVTQQVIYGLATLIALIVSIIGMSIVGKMLCNKDSWNYYDENAKYTKKGDISSPSIKGAILLTVCSIFVIAFIVSIITFFEGGIGQLFNPHFYAIKSLIEIVK